MPFLKSGCLGCPVYPQMGPLGRIEPSEKLSDTPIGETCDSGKRGSVPGVGNDWQDINVRLVDKFGFCRVFLMTNSLTSIFFLTRSQWWECRSKAPQTLGVNRAASAKCGYYMTIRNASLGASGCSVDLIWPELNQYPSLWSGTDAQRLFILDLWISPSNNVEQSKGPIGPF